MTRNETNKVLNIYDHFTEEMVVSEIKKVSNNSGLIFRMPCVPLKIKEYDLNDEIYEDLLAEGNLKNFKHGFLPWVKSFDLETILSDHGWHDGQLCEARHFLKAWVSYNCKNGTVTFHDVNVMCSEI